MDVGTSKGLESFLAFLRETTERHRMAEADRAEAEAATQDLLHALELGDDKAPGRARLGLKIREVRRFLGKPTSKKDREELLKLTTPELASAAQALGAAVHLRQQMEIAEFTRGLIEQQKAAQEPQGGPLPC